MFFGFGLEEAQKRGHSLLTVDALVIKVFVTLYSCEVDFRYVDVLDNRVDQSLLIFSRPNFFPLVIRVQVDAIDVVVDKLLYWNRLQVSSGASLGFADL